MGKYKRKNFYAIAKGWQGPCIVNTWEQCFGMVQKFPGAQFKGFKTKPEAEAWMEERGVDLKAEKVKQVPKKKKKKAKKDKPKKNTISFLKKPQEAGLNLTEPVVLARRTYKCPVTGKYFKNRVVLRQHGRTVGKDYVPSDDTSVPWDTED